MDIKDVLQEFKEQLKMVYRDNLKEVILFGSWARGDATEESDIDVLVVLNRMANFKKEHDIILDIVLEVEKKYDYKIVISAIPVKEKDFRSRMTPLFLNIRNEGVLV